MVVTPRKATYKDLSVYHTRDYLDAVLDTSHPNKGIQIAKSDVAREFGLEDVNIILCLYPLLTGL